MAPPAPWDIELPASILYPPAMEKMHHNKSLSDPGAGLSPEDGGSAPGSHRITAQQPWPQRET